MESGPHYSETCQCRNCKVVRNAGRFQPGQLVKRHIHGTPIHDWTVVSYIEQDDVYLLECGGIRRYFKPEEIRAR